jgi:MarR family transcriptional regulator for hemolysin
MQQRDSQTLIHTTSQFVNAISDQSFREMLAYLHRSGISLPRYSVLRILERQPGMTTSALSDELHLTLGSTSQLIDRLELDQLIVRQDDPHDKRIRRIYLQEQGLQILHQVQQISTTIIMSTINQAPLALQHEFASVLEKLLPYTQRITRD